MTANSAQEIETALARLDQYGFVLIRNLPTADRLFCDAVLGRFNRSVLLTDLSDLIMVQQQLARALGSASSPESILAATRQLSQPLPVVVFADQISVDVLNYLVQLGAVVGDAQTRLPLLLLETPALKRVWQTAEGAVMLRRVALSLSVEVADRGSWQVALAVLVLLAGGSALGYMVGWADWQSNTAQAIAQPEPQVQAIESAPVSAATDELTAPPAPLPLLMLSAADEVTIQQTVEQWRLAWQSQDWERYVGSYVSFYLPMDDNLSHEQWVSWRRARIERPDWIRIQIADLQLHPLDHYQVRVTFQQSYEAPGYRDSALKELYLVRLGNDWRINAERSLDNIASANSDG